MIDQLIDEWIALGGAIGEIVGILLAVALGLSAVVWVMIGIPYYIIRRIQTGVWGESLDAKFRAAQKAGAKYAQKKAAENQPRP